MMIPSFSTSQQRMSGLKASAGLGLALSDRAEHDAAPGARNALIPTQALPSSSRIAARHLRKPISPDMFLDRPVFNPHSFDPVPLPFTSPMTVDDFTAWREEGNGNGSTIAAPGAGGSNVPNLDVPLARSKKEKKDKKDKGLNTGRKTKRSARPKDTPHGDAPPPPPIGVDAPAFPPPPPGPAPPPPI